MKLKNKFAINIFLSIGLSAAVCFTYFLQFKEHSESMKHHHLIYHYSQEAFNLNYLTYQYLISPSQTIRSQWLLQKDRLASLQTEAADQKIAGDGSLLAGLGADFSRLEQAFAELSTIDREPWRVPADKLAAIRPQLASQLLDGSREIFAKSLELGDGLNAEAMRTHRIESLYLVAGILLLVLLSLNLTAILFRNIFPRQEELLQGFAEISQGNLLYRLQNGRNDELGRLARSFNSTVARLGEMTVSRERLEKEIEARIESQKRLELVEQALSESQDIILMFDVDRRIFYANKGAQHILDSDREALLTRRLEELIPELSRETGRIFFSEAADTGRARRIDLELQGPDSGPVPVEANIQFIPGSDVNDPGYYIFIGRDITERKRLAAKERNMRRELEKNIRDRTAELQKRAEDSEQLNRAMINLLEDLQKANNQLELTTGQLQQTNDELESFSYSVSHDLRSPLRHMSGFVHLLRKHSQDKLDETSLHYIEIINKSTTRMGHLIDDLLRYSRTGRADIHLSEMDNNLLVREIISELDLSEPERRMDWRVGGLPPAYGDRNLLKIVWTNLLENAIKFTANRDPAQIEIGSKTDPDGNIVYFVRDNGAGYDMKYKDKLFGVFQRLHRDSEFPGTGIGLATVQRIIHRHSGRVWSEGEVDRGAAFYFTIPRRL